jgi:hypothetical protein
LSIGFKWWTLIANSNCASYLLSYNTQVHGKNVRKRVHIHWYEMKLINHRLRKTILYKGLLCHIMDIICSFYSLCDYQHLWETKQKSQQWLHSSQRLVIMAQMKTNVSRNSYLSILLQTLTHFQKWKQCDIIVAFAETMSNSSQGDWQTKINNFNILLGRLLVHFRIRSK